ncbi:MAG: hypothetical protein ACLP4V_22415, partial [Methylocella sp.]
GAGNVAFTALRDGLRRIEQGTRIEKEGQVGEADRRPGPKNRRPKPKPENPPCALCAGHGAGNMTSEGG